MDKGSGDVCAECIKIEREPGEKDVTR